MLRAFLTLLAVSCCCSAESIGEWLNTSNERLSQSYILKELAKFEYVSATGEDDSVAKKVAEEATNAYSALESEIRKELDEKLIDVSAELLSDTEERQIDLLKQVCSIFDDEKGKLFEDTVAKMKQIHKEAEICPWIDGGINCDGEFWNATTIQARYKKSQDTLEQQYLWTAYRDAIGPRVRAIFPAYVEMLNFGARNAGHENAKEGWEKLQETEDLDEMLNEVWADILPLYEQLHAYLRSNLEEKYPEIGMNSAIPVYVLGDLWGQSFSALCNETAPYPDEEEKQDEVSTVQRIKQLDVFYQSLGFDALPPLFYEKSRFGGTSKGCCHSVWNMLNGDVRYTECENKPSRMQVASQMGSLQYAIQMRPLPFLLQRAAHSALECGIGGAVGLSTDTSSHLFFSGLTDTAARNDRRDFNAMYSLALDKLAFLPYALALHRWRSDILDGTVEDADQWNTHWWRLRHKYQGVDSPMEPRVDELDAASKYHVVANLPYIASFMGTVLQFQLYEKLCEKAGHSGPLHTCNFYNTTAVGEELKTIMQKGSLESWSSILEKHLGTERINASALMKYFQPLHDWLAEQNSKKCFGWSHNWPEEYDLPQPRCTADAEESLEEDIAQFLGVSGDQISLESTESDVEAEAEPKAEPEPKSEPEAISQEEEEIEATTEWSWGWTDETTDWYRSTDGPEEAAAAEELQSISEETDADSEIFNAQFEDETNDTAVTFDFEFDFTTLEPDSAAEPKSEPDAKDSESSEAEPRAEPKAEPKAEPEPKSEPEPEPNSEPEPKKEPESSHSDEMPAHPDHQHEHKDEVTTDSAGLFIVNLLLLFVPFVFL